MIVRILFELFLFTLPFLLYGLYWRLIGRAAAEGSSKAHPWTLLFATALGIVVASFLWWGFSTVGPAGGVYIPPSLENGEIVPGRVEPSPRP